MADISTSVRTPLDASLFVDGPQPHLLASRCAECNSLTFPQQSACPRCSSLAVAVEGLPSRGTLWTWTSQHFVPKAPYRGSEDPASFTPWYVGYVEFDEGLVVEGRLTGIDDRLPMIGEAMHVVVVPFAVDEQGNDITLYAFAPVGQG